MTRRAFLSHGTIANGFSQVMHVLCLGWPTWLLRHEARDQRTFGPKQGDVVRVRRHDKLA